MAELGRGRRQERAEVGQVGGMGEYRCTAVILEPVYLCSSPSLTN